MNIEFPEPKKCRRCKKEFTEGDTIVPFFHRAKGRKQFHFGENWKLVPNGKRYFNSGDAIGKSAWYHGKCVPPNIWRSLNLSGRTGPATPASSENDMQDVGPQS